MLLRPRSPSRQLLKMLVSRQCLFNVFGISGVVLLNYPSTRRNFSLAHLLVFFRFMHLIYERERLSILEAVKVMAFGKILLFT